MRLADMRLVQCTILFDMAVSVVDRVVDDEINPRLMCDLKMILQALEIMDMVKLQIDALALELGLEITQSCIVQKLGPVVFGVKAVDHVREALSILDGVFGDHEIGVSEFSYLKDGRITIEYYIVKVDLLSEIGNRAAHYRRIVISSVRYSILLRGGGLLIQMVPPRLIRRQLNIIILLGAKYYNNFGQQHPPAPRGGSILDPPLLKSGS
jgi:hypothetical protein